MEIVKAKYFVCWDTFSNTLYKAKKLQTLFDEVELARDYIGLMAVLDTEIGEVLFKVEETYYGEPILMERVMHIKSFMGFHTYAKIVEL